jgi:hypothetical protein
MSYEKYLKYKTKYLNLKTLIENMNKPMVGGAPETNEDDNTLPDMLTETPVSEQFGGKTKHDDKKVKHHKKKHDEDDDELEISDSESSDSELSKFSDVESSEEDF